MRISDWSSDVCSSDLVSLGLVRNGERFREMQTFTMKLWTAAAGAAAATTMAAPPALAHPEDVPTTASPTDFVYPTGFDKALSLLLAGEGGENGIRSHRDWPTGSAEHTSEFQPPIR